MLCRPITFRQSTKQREINWTIWNGARARVSSFSRHIVWRLKLTCEWRNQQIFNKSLVFHYRFTGRWNTYNTCKQSYQLMSMPLILFEFTAKNRERKTQIELNYLRPHLLIAVPAVCILFHFVSRTPLDCCKWNFYSSNSLALLLPLSLEIMFKWFRFKVG